MSVAARRRRWPQTAASGSAHSAYHGRSHAVEHSSASVVQPAAERQSAPRAVRHSANAHTAANANTNRCRHHVGVPLSPTRRAVSAGMLCTATSCCCSPIAPRKPSAFVPKPITPITAIAASAASAPAATPARARTPVRESTRNGNDRPADSFTPTPAASAAALAFARGVARAPSASAPAIASITSVSLCAPPTPSSSSTGLSPTNAAAHRPERPSALAACATSAIAARLASAEMTFSAHSPPPRPSGAAA